MVHNTDEKFNISVSIIDPLLFGAIVGEVLKNTYILSSLSRKEKTKTY